MHQMTLCVASVCAALGSAAVPAAADLVESREAAIAFSAFTQRGSGAPAVEQEVRGDSFPGGMSTGHTSQANSTGQYSVGYRADTSIEYLVEGGGSLVRADRIGIELTARSNAALANDERFPSVEGYASSFAQAVFAAAETIGYRLTATFTAGGAYSEGGVASLGGAISLDVLGDGEEYEYEFPIAVIDDTIAIDFEGIIDAGSTVVMETSLFSFARADAVGSSANVGLTLDLDIEFFPIPAPGTAALLAPMGLLAVRRRR